MKRLNWQIVLGAALVLSSALVYLIHYFIFRDLHHIFIYLIGDIGFVFIEVLMVTLIIHRILTVREKRSMIKKLNMVIGSFFSEVGTNLLKTLATFDVGSKDLTAELVVRPNWTDADFMKAHRCLKGYSFDIESRRGDLDGLKGFLAGKRNFMLRLLENPNLLEHDTFTDLLWAIFHLTEELIHRKDVATLPVTDYNHISGDIKRAYMVLISEWIDYMKHLKHDYPYLFSLAVRTNPFDPNASVEVQ
ncbi:MAG: hypothetical protein ABH875_01315 [Candidatus Omnitrophota bacterium]